MFRERGFGAVFWLNLLLTACGCFPGIFHALWMMADIADEAALRAGQRNLSPARS